MKKRTRSLSVRLPLLFVASVLIIMAVVIPLVFLRFHSRMIDQYTRMAKGVTQLMVNSVDGDKMDEYMEKNFSLPEYKDTVDYYYTLRDSYPDILYMYIYRFEEDGGHVIIDLDADWWENGEGYEPGYVYETEEPFTSHLAEVMAGKEIAEYSEHTKEDGYLFTYTRPIFKSDGTYAATACVDFSMDYLSGMDIAFTLRLALILFGIGLLVLILDIHIVRRSVTLPIDELSHCADKFAYDTEEDRKNNIELLDELNIHTGDEIEDVYHTLQSVTRDSFQAASNLNRALTDIRERDGMITAMAADYRSIYYANLDRDECLCVRATKDVYTGRMWEGKTFSFLQGFTEYARHCVAESDQEAFLHFIDPDHIREMLATEAMISLRYLTSKDGVEEYEMLRVAGVRSIEERDDHIVHAIGAGFSNVDKETRESMEQNRALADALTRAEEANVAKTAFLSSMSHEIRTPMNAIIGLDKIALKDPNISPQTRDELEKIGSSARHLLALINDILDMSRIESGRMVLKEEEFSFREMIEQINIIIHGQCEDKGLTFVCNKIEPLDDYFIGDDLRLRQVIINILGNAVKFTSSPGTVTFTVEQPDLNDEENLLLPDISPEDDLRILRFTMADTGIGMDEAFIPRLFEPFAQEDATSTNRYGGSGLGMAITKNMIDLMDGRIEVESKQGVGTTFTAYIPLRKAHHIDGSGQTDQSDQYDQTVQKGVPEISFEGMNVLIAEDMALNAEILADLLELEDISSEWAENGQLAVEIFAESQAGHFDAILMDMRMPVMDGLTATREIRKLNRPDAATIPIIALTANAFDEDVKQCLQAGMNAHLSKPVDIELLKDTIARIGDRGQSPVSL